MMRISCPSGSLQGASKGRMTYMDLKGSKTEKHLLAAFPGESQARNRYSFFASAAKKEGAEQIAAIFLQTAKKRRNMQRSSSGQLKGGDVEITASYPGGVIGKTKENLAAAAAGEMMEWGTLYPHFAATADKEGFRRSPPCSAGLPGGAEPPRAGINNSSPMLRTGKVFKTDMPVTW